MVRHLVFLPSVLFAGAVAAAPLDDALALATSASPLVRAQQQAADTLARQSDWSANVRFGYAAKGTFAEADGFNVALTVAIPLDSHKRQLDSVRAQGEVAKAQDGVAKTFLADVERLSALAVDARRARELGELARDRLLYFKQGVDAGRFDPEILWQHAEAAKQAEHAHRAAAAKLDAALSVTARYFGGTQWKRLRDLLAAHVKQPRP